MAVTFKVLGQSNPTAGALTTLYTVPVATSTNVGSIIVCNQGTYDVTFRISVAIAGAADDPKQYLYYDILVPANDTFIAILGLTMAATDVLRCYSKDSSVLSFSAFGSEIT